MMHKPLYIYICIGTIEGIIKQRIKDSSWDDVERKLETKEKEYRPREELSTEKSEYGLAEIYEREYLEMQRKDNKTEADDKLLVKHKEISVLFSSLCHNLDALSNFHMTPKPPREEMQVKSQPALNMEEAIPMAVSDARTKAPEEVFGSTSRGNIISREEMTKEEKVANRMKKKKRRQKKNRRQPKKENENSQAHIDNTIRLAKNVESIDTSRTEKVNYTNSKSFFKTLEANQTNSENAQRKPKKQKVNHNFKM